MAITKLQAESLNLADDFTFTGTVAGAGEPSYLVKLASTTVSSSVSSVSFDGYFDDNTYNTYKVFINNASLNTGNSFGFRVNVSNSPVTTSTYYYVAIEGNMLKDSSSNVAVRSANTWGYINLTGGWGTSQVSSTYTNNFEISFGNPTQANSSKAFNCLSSFLSENNPPYLVSQKVFGYNTGTSGLTGLTFINSSGGNITGGTFTLYGIV